MKHIIITGTSRGIGYQLVQQYVKAGHKVLALSRNTAPITALKLDNCIAVTCDISDEKDLDVAVNSVKENWGVVDVIINNAGYLVNKPFEKLSLHDFKQSYDVNVFGPALLIQKMLPFMNVNGHVVNISSMGGIQGSMKFPGLAAYSSSKGAIITLTELLAEEYKEKGPSFNVLALGAVQTEMLEEAFPGYQAPLTAKEMANYIMDFSLNGHRFYNGKVLEVSSSTP